MRKLVREVEAINDRLPAPEVNRGAEATGDASQDRDRDSIYQDLYDLAPVGFYTLDRAARICELNERGAKLIGFAAHWLLGKSFVVFVARQHLQPFLNFLTNAPNSSEIRTIDVDMFASHRTVPVQISMTSIREGESVFHRLTVVDMTEYRKTEKLLKESLSNWYSLVHSAPDTIMIVEPHGSICFVNKPTWGYSTNALQGTNLLDHIPDTHHVKLLRCLEHSFRYNKRTTCEVTGMAGYQDRWFNLSFGPPHAIEVAAIGGTATATATATATTTVIIREISESKRAEESLRTSGEKLRDFAARLETVREEERTRVAREIHDELGQALTALKLDLSWVQRKTRGPVETRERMKAMMAHIDETIDCVRKIASDLRPAVLDDLGLIPAIEWQVSEFRKRTGIRTEIVCKADGVNLQMHDSVSVFRVVQEALTNIMRHAKCTRVRISVERMAGGLTISVADNGRGIARTEQNDLKSLGIVGMKERVSRLGGEFNIFSEPGKGTRLDINIPTQND